MKVELIFRGAEASIHIKAEDRADRALLTACKVQSGALFRVTEVLEPGTYYGSSHQIVAVEFHRQPPRPPDPEPPRANFITPSALTRLLEIEAAARWLQGYVQTVTAEKDLVPQYRALFEALERPA